MRAPVTVGHDLSRVIGFIEIDESQLPEQPDFVLSISYRPRDNDLFRTRYVLLDVGIISDAEYAVYLKEKLSHA